MGICFKNHLNMKNYASCHVLSDLVRLDTLFFSRKDKIFERKLQEILLRCRLNEKNTHEKVVILIKDKSS